MLCLESLESLGLCSVPWRNSSGPCQGVTSICPSSVLHVKISDKIGAITSELNYKLFSPVHKPSQMDNQPRAQIPTPACSPAPPPQLCSPQSCGIHLFGDINSSVKKKKNRKIRQFHPWYFNRNRLQRDYFKINYSLNMGQEQGREGATVTGLFLGFKPNQRQQSNLGQSWVNHKRWQHFSSS